MLAAVFLIKRFAFICTSIGTNPSNNVPVYSSFREIYLVNPQNFQPRFLSQNGIFYICIPVQVDYAIQNDFVDNNINDQADSIFKDQNRSEESIIKNVTSTNPRYVCKKDSSYTSENPQRSRATSDPPNSIINNKQELNSNSKKNPTESHDPKPIEDNKNLSGSYDLSKDGPLHDLVDLNMHDFKSMLDTSVNIHTNGKKSKNENGRIQKHNETRKSKNFEDQAIFSEELDQIENRIPDNAKRMKLDDSSIVHKAASIISEEDESDSSTKTDYINWPGYKYIDTLDLEGQKGTNNKVFEQEKVSVVPPSQICSQNSDNSLQNIPTEYQSSSKPVNLLVTNPDHTFQSLRTPTNGPETLDENIKNVYRFNLDLMIIYSKIIDNVEILKNVNLSKEVNIKEINLHDRLLCEDRIFLKEVLKLEQKHRNSKNNDFYCFSFEKSFLKETILKKFHDKYTEIVEDIRIINFYSSCRVINYISSSLHEKFNIFFENKFVECVFENPSPEHYWEFLKIFVDIARDPLFSVILPEFSTFDLKRNFFYFKFVDNLDFLNVLKFKLILKSYKFLFDRVQMKKTPSVKKRISIFVFNTRYFLRRYLICCLSSIWESNIRKVYMRITCHNIDNNINIYENIHMNSKRHTDINREVEYKISRVYMDQKEFLIRLFFQIDLKNFMNSLGLKILVRRRDDFSYNCFFKNYLFKIGNDPNISNLYINIEHIYGIYKTYSHTLKIYMGNSKNSISNVFLNPKFIKELEFSDLQKVKDKQFGNDYSKNYIDDDLNYELLNFKDDIFKHQQLLAYYDDQNIVSLADSIIL